VKVGRRWLKEEGNIATEEKRQERTKPISSLVPCGQSAMSGRKRRGWQRRITTSGQLG
jgi:hypothetical protein